MIHLLDTHAFLWFIADNPKLPRPIKAIVESPDSAVQISIASLWEIGIKNSIGKLQLKTDIYGLEAEANILSIEILPISIRAIHQLSLLPSGRSDPFDRVIAATAITEGDILLSGDTAFDGLGVQRVW